MTHYSYCGYRDTVLHRLSHIFAVMRDTQNLLYRRSLVLFAIYQVKYQLLLNEQLIQFMLV